MELKIILHYVDQFGYAALFFLLWLGIVGMPIPDEVIVMTGGFITSLGILKTVPALLVTYAGVVSGLSIGYGLGRGLGAPILKRISQKKNIDRYIQKAHRLAERYGPFSLVISYFFPIVRHIVPYIVGINKMPYHRYALCSYTTGFIWTCIFFTAGRYLGGFIKGIDATIKQYSWISIIIFLLILMLYWIFTKLKMKNIMRL